MDKYHIPQHLDMPLKVVLWTCDEVLVFAAPFVSMFFLMDSPLTGIVIGMILVMALRKIKGEEGHYFLAHCAYWYLPPLVQYKATPPSYLRCYLG